MNKDQFKGICRKTQDELKSYVVTKLKKHYDKIHLSKDFVYAEGSVPICLVAHMDTVHKESPKTFVFEGDKISSPQGIGGDDRCGVYGIVKVYEATKQKPWLLFTCDEEIGGRGADGFCAAYLKGELPERLNDLKMLVELDRKGKNDAVYYSCDNPEFEEYITSKGFRTSHGSFSDISSIAPCLGVAAVNLSCGYYNAHTLHECINRKHLNATVRKVIGMVSDAEKPDFPKYDYIRSQRNYYYGSLWDDPYADWEGYESGAMTGEPPKDLPPEYEEIYEELLDIYEPEELDYFRMEYGNPILRELYEQEYCLNTGRR